MSPIDREEIRRAVDAELAALGYRDLQQRIGKAEDGIKQQAESLSSMSQVWSTVAQQVREIRKDSGKEPAWVSMHDLKLAAIVLGSVGAVLGFLWKFLGKEP